MDVTNVPFTTNLLQVIATASQPDEASQNPSASHSSILGETFDSFPAFFRDVEGCFKIPGSDPRGFLSQELSLAKLDKLAKYFWAVGAKRPATPLHRQILSGRDIIVTESIDLHLVWVNDGRIFIKPLPRFLLDPEVWRKYLTSETFCQASSTAGILGDAGSTPQTQVADRPTSKSNQSGADEIRGSPQMPEILALSSQTRGCALGFLYTYVSLIPYESDFAIAKEKRLLPQKADGSEIQWREWKKFVEEFLDQHDHANIHPRFHRGELRLSRLNFFSRFTQWPLFTSYLRGWRNYSSLIRDNITSLVTATVFIALVLTAMQVALATDQLKKNSRFMAVSYGFSVFTMTAPLFMVLMIIMQVLYNLLKDNWSLLGKSVRAIAAATKTPTEGEHV